MNTLDRAVNNDFLVVSKSLLPYLNSDKQRTVAIFIKVMELIYTMNVFSNESSVRSMSRSAEEGWEKDFLNDVKNNLSDDKAYFIDAILKLTEAKDLLTRQEDHLSLDREPDYHLHPEDSGILESAPFPSDAGSADISDKSIPPFSKAAKSSSSASNKNGPSPEQIVNGLSSLLDPNQAQLLKVLSTILKPSSN